MSQTCTQPEVVCHSITSSARASSIAGISRPNAFVAVARDHTTAIEQSCELSVGYDTRQLVDPRDEVDAIGDQR